MKIVQELKWRGLVKQITNEEKIAQAQKLGKGVYCGFDPTADSLHVGHLIPIILLERFRRAGFQPIALIGGGTGMIGDPSFKAEERPLQTDEQVEKYVQAIKKQLEKIIPQVQVMNNATWLKKISLIDFLRDVGKDFNLSYLLVKDSIARRIDAGLSITEFLYTMLQAYDFYYLYTHFDCLIQIGGSDQWGNITSGTDYISQQVGKDNSQAAGLTIPLLTKKDGNKFGKTESGAVWLDPKKTSEYEFYQFWYNQDDQDAAMMLKCFTFLSAKEIDQLVTEHLKNPRQHVMQQKLAAEMTNFVHGKTGLDRALKLTKAFFAGEIDQLSPELLTLAIQSLPTTEFNLQMSALEIIVSSGAASSKREAREFIQSAAITFNGKLIGAETMKVEAQDLLLKKYLLLKKGKRKYFVLIAK